MNAVASEWGPGYLVNKLTVLWASPLDASAYFGKKIFLKFLKRIFYIYPASTVVKACGKGDLAYDFFLPPFFLFAGI